MNSFPIVTLALVAIFSLSDSAPARQQGRLASSANILRKFERELLLRVLRKPVNVKPQFGNDVFGPGSGGEGASGSGEYSGSGASGAGGFGSSGGGFPIFHPPLGHHHSPSRTHGGNHHHSSHQTHGKKHSSKGRPPSKKHGNVTA